MYDLRLGMKIYDNSWFLTHELEPQAAADVLSDMGVTFVITQSQYLPMADTAVQSSVRPKDAARYAQLDDRQFRAALRDRGIGYVACLNVGFDPHFTGTHAALVSTDQFGQTATQQDWYIGLPPDRDENIEHKAKLLETATAALDPDGIHLGFMRWPGFWETWLPGTSRALAPDYCYSSQTLTRFCTAVGIDLPVQDPVRSAMLISDRHRMAWRDWKCRVTVEAIAALHARVSKVKPDLPIAINTLPFTRTDFGNAVEEVFGQDIHALTPVVDIFEVMAYHQILGRDAAWPAAIAADIKARTTSKVIATLQVEALYLHGMHRGRGRAPTLDAAEFARAVDLVELSPADGLCVFTFTDFLNLRHTPEGHQKIERLKRFRR